MREEIKRVLVHCDDLNFAVEQSITEDDTANTTYTNTLSTPPSTISQLYAHQNWIKYPTIEKRKITISSDSGCTIPFWHTYPLIPTLTYTRVNGISTPLLMDGIRSTLLTMMDDECVVDGYEFVGEDGDSEERMRAAIEDLYNQLGHRYLVSEIRRSPLLGSCACWPIISGVGHRPRQI